MSVQRQNSSQSAGGGLLERVSSETVSLETLRHIKASIDEEILNYTTQEHPNQNPDLGNQRLTHIIFRLSENLVIYHDQEVSVFLEVQLRTLIAAFALLHFQGGTGLPADIYDRIEGAKFGSLYSTITQQRRDGGSPITATNVYLIQVALQYLSLFECIRNRERETTRHVVNIVFSTLMIPAQQYQNTLGIVGGIRDLTRIWRYRRPQQFMICVIQEHVRRVTEGLKKRDRLLDLDLRIETMLETTLDQLESILRAEFARNPNTLNEWHATRNILQLGPPEINAQYYLYGLLDCTAQIGSSISLSDKKPTLYGILEGFTLSTRVKVFRWKAGEALLSSSTSRSSNYNRIQRLIDEDRTLSIREKTQKSNDIQLVYEMLELEQANIVRSEAHSSSSEGSTANESSPDLSPINSQTTDSLRDNRWNEGNLQQFRPRGVQSKTLNFSSDLKRIGVHKSINTIVAKNLQSQETIFEHAQEGGQIKAFTAKESPEFLEIFVAQGQGEVSFFKLRETQQQQQQYNRSRHRLLQIDGGDFATHLSLCPKNRVLAILTHRNFLYVLPIVPDLPQNVRPFPYRHGDYNPDSGAQPPEPTGLTSASFYSPAGSLNTYTFCTSFPSQTRSRSKGNWRIKGEWPYISPSPPPPLEPPSDLVVNLTQFNEGHGGLLAGAASNKANVFAVLEKQTRKRRRVLWLPIQAHELGGVYCTNMKPNALDFELTAHDQEGDLGPRSCALAFRDIEDEGTCLVAADITGRVWEVPFEPV